MKRNLGIVGLIAGLGFVGTASASELDVASVTGLIWMGICCALVLLMQPGFALLESGLSRSKNAVNVIMKNFADLCIGSLAFWAFGYGLMFGDNPTGFFGVSDFLVKPEDGDTALNILYQMLFAATAATIVSGAVAERIRFIPYIIGAAFIIAVVYPLFGAWSWGEGGWLQNLGFVDAAGATVVHSIGGWCALGAVLALGPRLGRFSRKGAVRDIPGHNLPMFALGSFLLWVGWFGFNGGAAVQDFSNLGTILLNTHLSAAAGVASALFFMHLLKQPVLMTTSINGALGGLVGITAGCATMTPGAALLTGLVSGGVVVFGTTALLKLRVDDVVGAIPVHGMCGAWGTLAAGMFYAPDMFSVYTMVAQLIGIVAAFAWAFPLSYGVFKLIDVTLGLRASTQHEQRGMDYSEHYETGYADFINAGTTHQAKA